jgi:ATP/maltotriose-dependent transcriptional regulator MalT
MERFAWEEALRFARRAGELSQDLSEQFIALHAGIEAAWRLGRVPEVWPDLDVLESMGERLGTAQRVASLLLRNTCAAVIAARSEQRRAIAAFEEIALETDNDAWRSEALFARAQLSSMEGRFSDAETELRAALEANESTGEHERLVRIRELLVQTLFRQSKLIEGRELVEVLRADAQTGSIREREAFLTGQIRLAVATEDPQAYRTARELALQHANYLGDVRSFIISTNELAYGSQLAWDTSGARAAYGQAIELARERGFVAYSVTATINLAHVELEVGHVDRAASLWHEARPPARRHELYISLICIAINLADVALRQGNLGEAMLEATSAYQMARERAEPRLVAEALSLLGAAETGQGAADAGLAHMREGLAIRRTLNSPRTLANELCSYAEALLLAGCTDEAIVIATELRDLTVADPEHQLSPGRICLVLARVAKAAGNLVEEERFRKLGRRVVDSVLRRLSDPEDRAAFAALPAHQFLMEVRA